MESRIVKPTFRRLPKGEEFKVTKRDEGVEMIKRYVPCIIEPYTDSETGKTVFTISTRLRSGKKIIVGRLAENDPNKKHITKCTKGMMTVTTFKGTKYRDGYTVKFD